VTAGILILLFVTYQLWGTGLYTSREQDSLRDQFTSSVNKQGDNPVVSSTTSVTDPTAPTTTTTTPVPLPVSVAEGDPIAQIRIPRIDVNSIVLEGVSREDLRRGPGHYPDTPLPGQAGNAAIAGHRTTYGAPFGNLDQLEEGDRIFVRTSQGNFTYVVYDASLDRGGAPRIVKPTDLKVLEPDPSGRSTITLTTCHPKYSAAQRLIVKAVLQEEALPATHTSGKTPKLTEDGLSGEDSSKLPTLISGLIAAAIGLLWWLFFHRHPSLTNWLIGVVPFGAALLVFYALLERVLPSNY
jgi:sortase A